MTQKKKPLEMEVELQQRQEELELINKELAQSQMKLEVAYRQYTDLYDFAPVGYLTMTRNGAIHQVNLAGANLLGVNHSEATQVRLAAFVSSESRPAFDIFFEKLLSGEGKESCELVLKKRGDGQLWARLEASCFENGNVCRALLTDITERKRMASLLQARVRISEFAESHTFNELLQKTLDEAELLTGSQIGFAHFLEADQKTLQLQMWSTNTLKNMCTAEGSGQHYSVDEAGVWADSVSTRAPVIHNNYADLPHRKGLPQGHALLVRELIVPVVLNDLIMMIMGVGNKPTDYDENDIETLSQLANLAWDIVQRKQAEELLKESEWRNRIVSELITDYIFVVDVEPSGVLKLSWASNNLFRITGRMIQDVATSDLWENLIHPNDRVRFFDFVNQILSTAEVGELECRTFYKFGGERWIRIFARPQVDERNRVTTIVGAIQDITQRKQADEQLQESEILYRKMNENSPLGMHFYKLNEKNQLIFAGANPAADKLLGVDNSQFIGKTIEEAFPPLIKTKVPERYRDTAAKGIPWSTEQIIYDDRQIKGVFDVRAFQTAPGNMVAIFADITERKLAEQALEAANRDLQTALALQQQLAHTDELTGINNRRHLYELAEHEFEIATRYQQPLSVIMFDIDHFKQVNDTFGHTVGDQILQRVTQVASAELRSADVIGRYGGEEFVIILSMTNAKKAYPLAERIRLGVSAMRVSTEKGDATVTLSIGIVEITHGAENQSIEAMIRNADEAMYAAKQAGRNRTEIGNL
jgi:diguanylate cyclase (GGDEF)-like protein/PAS domain S-box-containing protein